MRSTRVGEAFLRYHAGEWTMPAKVYLQSPPHGDFRAMPARGDELALLKWITSFPGNPARGLPTVNGVICLSDATTGLPLMLLDARSVTALRTGAVAAVAAEALARARGSRPSGSSAAACTAPGPRAAWPPPATARASAATPPPMRPQALADELGWRVGRPRRGARLRHRLLRHAGRRAGDRRRRPATRACTSTCSAPTAPARPRPTVGAVAACALFCDEWAQASHGGELTGAIEAGLVHRAQVTELGAVLAGDQPGRPDDEAVTLFDSTGLAIQDLAVAAAAYDAWRSGAVEAQTVNL